jgi:hypothetical protein
MTGIEIVGAITAAAAAGTAAYSAVSTGEATAQAAQYQAQVAANNATIEQQNAAAAIKAGEVQAEQTGLQSAQQIEAIRAAEGANNVDVNSGSALDVQTGQRLTNVSSELLQMNNALRQAYGYEVQGTGFSATSTLGTAQAQQASTAGALKAAGGLLGSANQTIPTGSGTTTLANSVGGLFSSTPASGS